MYLRPGLKLDVYENYECLLLHVNDALVLSKNAEIILINEIGKYFEIKEETIWKPKTYFSGYAKKAVLENLVETWALSSSQCVKCFVNKVEIYLKE